jgi:hypothetical protein
VGERETKDALFDAFGDVAKALANGRRAELIDVLAQGERHVEDLAARSARASPTRRSISGCWPRPAW